MPEKEVHQLIIDDENIRKDLASLLNINYSKMELIHEDQYINLMYADFTILYKNKIQAIVEVKGENINVTDYVRGIGQLFQYEYYAEEKINHLGFEYSDDFKVIYLFPNSVLGNNYFNIGLFKYPKSLMIIELNIGSKAIRLVTKKELEHFKKTQRENLVSISQYYIRDNRFFELYILLHFLLYLKVLGKKNFDRTKMEVNFLRKIGTPNNNNWRNAFISLSSLGFIDKNNNITQSGILMAIKTFEEFLLDIYNSYIEVYITGIFEVIGINVENNNLTISEIIEKIKFKWNNKDILFLTESNGRYISSWLNIMRDDFGIINFVSRSNERVINYNPLILNEKEIKNKISEYSTAHKHIDNYLNLLGREELGEL